MNKKIKLITLLLTLIFSLSVMSFTAYAVDGDDSGNYATEAPPVDDEPIVDPEPVPDDPTSPPDEPTDYPESSDTSSDSSDDDESDVSSDSSSYDDNSSSSDSSNYSSDYSDYSSQSSTYYDYEYNEDAEDSYSSTYSQSEMYNNAGKVDVNELSNDDWDAIAKGLANAESLDTGGGDDFNFIKKNNSSADNGLWMLITGAVLVILSILGISYVIITSMKAKRNYAYAGNNNPQKAAHKNVNRPSNDYGDGYSNSRRAPRKTKRMEDTSDIYLPKSTRNGGSRYRD